ncbi:metal-dependent hydrolase [Coralloluteibacterium stylophorae]|uniref:Metal-dependent hydrolase n=1 Tax=Coralloluteibacterium stylophorae TaxID=1776034 RepID=A0A8J8AYK8_9GAMM|nr:metal-dependent hydrolase [Coralloluteibacterium stylophorae]MBS7456043.1 metal-dependent hydrolase [Coralloluteibacterium stylophorae]
MDSLTQIVLGSTVAALAVPARHRRAALVAGAVLGTLPDLDALPLMLVDDPVLRMTWHRGPSHSLLVLPLVGWLAWALLARFSERVREAPRRWLAAVMLALLTHPLLDAFTVYGTQLFWPIPSRPVMGSSVFIIDPAYTLPLLVGVAIAAFAGARRLAHRALLAGAVLSSAYLGWSLAAKAMVDAAASRALAAQGLGDAPRFSVPTPFNTLLWRVVAMTPDGFVEGERSLVADAGPMRFRRHDSDTAALAAARDVPAVRRLTWFNHGFEKAEVEEGRLVLSDLRMGQEPDYTFRFAVARRDGEAWTAIPPEQLRASMRMRGGFDALWTRIWHEPQAQAPGTERSAQSLSSPR